MHIREGSGYDLGVKISLHLLVANTCLLPITPHYTVFDHDMVYDDP